MGYYHKSHAIFCDFFNFSKKKSIKNFTVVKMERDQEKVFVNKKRGQRKGKLSGLK